MNAALDWVRGHPSVTQQFSNEQVTDLVTQIYASQQVADQLNSEESWPASPPAGVPNVDPIAERYTIEIEIVTNAPTDDRLHRIFVRIADSPWLTQDEIDEQVTETLQSIGSEYELQQGLVPVTTTVLNVYGV